MKSKLSISKLFMRLEPGCTIQQAFARLSKPSHTTITLTEEDMLKLFGCEASSSSLADARCTYFKSLNTQDLNKSLRHLAPSESLLMTKILRSNLVAAHIWGNVLDHQDSDPTQYGWIIGRSTEYLVADLANKE